MTSTSSLLIETNWLAENLNKSDIKILDASCYMPNQNINAYNIYQQEHIPGALFFDIDKISDQKTDLPHMLPSPEQFAQHVGQMGLTHHDHIIVYDQQGLFSAARAWWTFRAMGHDRVSVLNGGLPKWKSEGRALEQGDASPQKSSHYEIRLQNHLVCSFDEILSEVNRHINKTEKTSPAQILDARSEPRFKGEMPEPRPGLKSGHMPGAINIPFGQLLNEDGTVKSKTDLEQVFIKAGVDLSKPVITSCGSGVTAAVLSFGLALIGHDKNSLYDGSWAEWGSRDEAPVVKG